MKRGWVEVSLGELVEHRKVFFEIDDLSDYKRCRVRLHAQGIQLRDEVPGALIETKKQQRCSRSDLLVAEIDAKVGGYGIVPEELDGAIVSSHYFLFAPKAAVIDYRYLGYVTRTQFFHDQVVARGSTNYAAIRPHHVLGYRIPLAPLSEQQRLVAHLEAIEDRLARSQELREQQEQQLGATLNSAFRRLEEDAEWVEMGEVAPLDRRPVSIEIDGEYPGLAARSFGRGIFHKPTLLGADLTWQKLFRVHAGDTVISNIKAWEGAIAVAGDTDHGRCASHRYLTCVADPERLLPEFLCFYLLSRDGLEKVGQASPGSADRNRTLAVKRLQKIEVPIPPLEAQRDFKRLLDLRTAIKRAASSVKERQDALVPSVLDRIFQRPCGRGSLGG